MPSDTEPRYRLVDSNGNVVGSLYAEADGTLKLQEATSGSDNEVSVATDGTFSAPAVSTGDIDTGRSWQEVTASRSLDSPETNDTGSEIKAFVMVVVESDTTEVNCDFRVDGVRVDKIRGVFGASTNPSGQFVSISPNSDYTIDAFGDTSNYSLSEWTEFR